MTIHPCRFSQGRSIGGTAGASLMDEMRHLFSHPDAVWLVGGLWVVFVFPASLIWILIGAGPDVLRVYETRLRLLGALVFVGCTSLAGIVGVVSFFVHLDGDLTGHTPEIPYLVFLTAPSLAAVWAYLRVPGYFRREYRPVEISPISDDWELVELTNDLSYQIGLRTPPRVQLTSRTILSPVVFGRSRRRSVLLLPYGFRQVLAGRAKAMEISTIQCLRFILLHELAHIRHGDAPFICWAYYFRRVMKKWLALGLFAGMVYSGSALLSRFYPFVESTAEFVSLSIHFWFLLAFYAGFQLIFFFLCCAVQRQRELNADARAWLHMPKQAAHGSSNNDAMVHSLLGLFDQPSGPIRERLVSFGRREARPTQAAVSHNLFAERLLRRIRGLGRKITSRYPEPKQRLDFVERIRSASQTVPPASDETAFWYGTSMGLVVIV